MNKIVTVNTELRTRYNNIQIGNRVMWFGNTGTIIDINWEYSRAIKVKEDITGREVRIGACRIITNE